MRCRLAGTLTWVLLLVLTLTVAGCTSAGGDSADVTDPPSSPAVSLAPSAVPGSLARTDPAVWAAVRFEQAHCSWTWTQPLAGYVTAQRALATTQYGQQLAAAADPVSWREEVVTGRQTVTCSITAAHRLVGAPTSPTSVYTRLTTTEHITSALGDFSGGERLVSLHVQLADGRWLVAGPYTGG